jgi:predicted ArsR family transcriptional regulator
VTIQGPVTARHSDRAPTLTRPRARVLELLQRLDSPAGVDDIASRLGLHVNTVRLHLDFLTEEGLVLRERAPGSGPGRPAWLYRADPTRPEPDPRVREYGALAGALAAHIARTSTHPDEDARAAGVDWGRREAVSRRLQATTPATARRDVVGVLDDLGFAPATNSRRTVVHLQSCPLLDVAREHPQVVCQAHGGLIAGLLESLGSDPASARLHPFSDPGSCRLDLAAAQGTASS